MIVVFPLLAMLKLCRISPVIVVVMISVISLSGCDDSVAQQGKNLHQTLEAEFASPPTEARPRVWWHWMNGNISEAGIVKDLEWMHRIGIGGVQNFDAAMETPIVVDQRISYMTPEWKKAFAKAVATAKDLKLEFAVASSAGWSLTGGPWVTPEDAMKKLVWSETTLAGGQDLRVPLAAPSGMAGPYQSIPAEYKHGHNPGAIPEAFYRDSLVLAYRLPETPVVVQKPVTVLANGVAIDAVSLLDDDLATGVSLPKGTRKTPGSIDIEYSQAQSVEAVVVYVNHLPDDFLSGKLQPTLEALSDGGEWMEIARVSLGKTPSTVSFKPVVASRFRLVFTREKPSGAFAFRPAPGIDPSGLGGLGSGSAGAPELADFRLYGSPRIDSFETKAGFRLVDDYHQLTTSSDAEQIGIAVDGVLDLTDKMDSEGVLTWSAPAGSWRVLRLGYALTGKTNSPATAEATGLEVDKYDAAAVERYLNTYLGNLREVVGDDLMGHRGLNALLTDSTEAGPSNWTPDIVGKFKALRGYDPTPWLPALTGEVMGSRRDSDAFLYDYRRTLAELVATQHYGTVAKVAQKQGLTVYGESLEANRTVSTLGDDLDMRRFADVPMAAMWTYPKGGNPGQNYIADMRGAASVAHQYGRDYVATESLTSILSPWAHAPADLQPMIDAEFLHGVNRPIIHTSPHQPLDDNAPGLSLHVFGQYFTRHETWAEMAKPWIDYIARNSYMLQQGQFVADVAYFYGEEPPLGVLAATRGYPQDVPRQYGYDFISAHTILNELYVENGTIKTKAGAVYRAIYLGGSSRDFMTLPVLSRLAQLVREGATLIGEPPEQSPSLADDAEQFSALVASIWAGEGETSPGRGQVVRSSQLEQALLDLGIVPDVSVTVSTGDLKSTKGAAGEANAVEFVHRKMPDVDIYYLANRGVSQNAEARFRVNGRVPEKWRADTGEIEPMSYRIEGGTTVVPLSMNDWESFFVVFRNEANQPEVVLGAPVISMHTEVEAPWTVDFEEDRGAPVSVVLGRLESLSNSTDPGVRYFSGVSTYTNSFNFEATDSDQKVMLDLGEVGDLAEVYVNDRYAGTAWKPPYRVDISGVVQDGNNTLTVKVANLWVNRLVGDRQPDNESQIGYTTFKTYLPSAPLRPSGLLGPVRVMTVNSNN
ncbi:glycoside hydrolase [Aestuariicella hydrocarbonica]|uniref:Glycoside hydrolase n=1 Tax=Pseudomaricurvus hydrocarbonicus TaxID=1470433 RepID=A0A9E5MMQ8_9GAMM|nr:glycosyl hydrolase [Aestuariicella hydrocarbonica]NHO67088.1 glycoside hydrolase [Aestuariicella hydrocarbonica]